MNVTSLGFLVLLGILICIYYVLPQRYRYHCLLIASLGFVATYQIAGLVFLLLSALVIWYGAGAIEKAAGSENEKAASRKKGIVAAVIGIQLGILFVLKYAGTWIGAWQGKSNLFSFLIPIGLSYYTLQSIGYILDVYWGKIPAEKSFGKMLLFLCYFPQMLQGPISRYKELSTELFEKEHNFAFHNIKYGTQRMLWGYFKVLVIGNWMGRYVGRAFYDADTAYGFAALLGLIFFGFQLYGNFSGGIDVMLGVSRCFGIGLPENFCQPFFARSLGDFWRRWHITLGTWMKDYVFFPFSMSRPVRSLKKKLKKKVSRKMANRIPIAAANLVVFLLVGIWHGTSTNYALWGLYNGLILAGGELLTDVFAKAKNTLRIDDKKSWWTGLCMVRTFLIVTLGWCTDCAATAAGSLQIIRNMMMVGKTNLHIYSPDGATGLICMAVGLGVLLIVSVLEEKKKEIGAWMDRRSVLIQMIVWAVFLQMIVVFSYNGGSGGFLYAEF